MPRLPKRALVLGATGLVGRHLVADLMGAGVAVTTAGRRPSPSIDSVPAPDFRPLDYDALTASPDAAGDMFEQCPVVFIALGTTLRKAGSKEAFRRVDFDYVRAAAVAARAASVPHLLVISSLGASSTAPTFYLQVKAEVEEAIRSIDFPSLTIARPSLLRGYRIEARRGEEVSGAVLTLLRPLLRGPFARYRPIHARTVARALVRTARDPAPGVTILESTHLARLGR